MDPQTKLEQARNAEKSLPLEAKVSFVRFIVRCKNDLRLTPDDLWDVLTEGLVNHCIKKAIVEEVKKGTANYHQSAIEKFQIIMDQYNKYSASISYKPASL